MRRAAPPPSRRVMSRPPTRMRVNRSHVFYRPDAQSSGTRPESVPPVQFARIFFFSRRSLRRYHFFFFFLVSTNIMSATWRHTYRPTDRTVTSSCDNDAFDRYRIHGGRAWISRYGIIHATPHWNSDGRNVRLANEKHIFSWKDFDLCIMYYNNIYIFYVAADLAGIYTPTQ